MKLLSSMLEDKNFLKKTALIAIPIGLQGLLNNVLNFVDTLMIGKLGDTTIASVGLANKVYFVFSLLLFGVCSGAGILSAQYWGKRDLKNIHRVLGMALSLGVLSSLVFLGASAFRPEFVMSIFTDVPDMITIGAKYLRIVCFSYLLAGITQVYMASLRSVNQVRIPVVISTIAIITNVVLNYGLIFGHLGMPKLGVEGAAIATVIARTTECVAMVGIVYMTKSPVAANLKEMLSFDREFVGRFFKTVSPVIVNEFMWGLGVTIYSVVYGRMGEAATAAITVTQSIEQIIQVVVMSISSATAVILGNELGAGKLKEAEIHAKYFIILQFIATCLLAVVFFIIREPIIGLFEMSAEVHEMVNKCFIVFLLFLVFKVFNTVNIVGILRSGGDTMAALLLDVTGVWMIGIPMAFLGGFVFKLPIHLVYAMVFIEEIYKLLLGFPRYRKKKWLRNIVAD
ncbi:MAG: MATE family efflux transporter [Lachnospiraceae bacterium]|nr:MATE family efflux transporter [Lachnospiraceae bacterium]